MAGLMRSRGGDGAAAGGESGPRPDPALRFGLLGALEVRTAAGPVHLTGRRVRSLLALLLVHANDVVSCDRLIDDLWAGEPTPGATATLQGYVSELRRSLADASGAPAPVVTRRPGYVLQIETDQLDVLRFERLVDNARAAARGQADRVAALLTDALALWRGPALADFLDEPFARPVAARLEETRLWALEERVEAELAGGGEGELVAELRQLTADNPLRERLWGQWMLALYRCGRQAEALRAYQDLRHRLVEELAIDPSPALQRLEHAILVQDPSLEAPAPGAPPATGPGPAPSGRSGPSRRVGAGHGLPSQLTRFVGRRRELQELAPLLAGTRLLTLAGPGGAGKTRLAVQLGAEEAVAPAQGARFVDLAAVDDPGQVPAAVALALGFDIQRVGVDTLCDRLGDDDVLLVLDNCEHVVDACAALVEAVLLRCPRVRILATSQEDLGLWGETVWRVPSLSLPGAATGSVDDLLESEAVQLFLDRASVANRELSRDRETLAAVARICRRLDGIPLAIELAAALVAALPVEEILRRLDDRFDLLVRGNRQAAPRQKTLRAAIEWSFELLAPAERDLLGRLSVFVGPFGMEAAEAVSGPGQGFPATLAALVSKSMVATVPGPGGPARYRLLDTLRQYGLEQLRASGAEAETRRLHAAHYLSFALAADRELHGRDAADWSTRMVSELPNLRAALEWSFADGDLEVGVELAGALRWWFFGRMGPLAQARQWLDNALARRAELPPALHLKALTAAMGVAFSQGDYQWTSQGGEEAVSLAEELDDHRELAVALMMRGGAAVLEGNMSRAVACLERSLVYCEEVGDRWGRAFVLTFSAMAARRSGRASEAKEQLVEALSIYRDVRDDHNQVIPLMQLALVVQQLGDVDEAGRLCDEAMVLAERLGDPQLAHFALCISGRVELARGRREEARQLLLRSLLAFREVEHPLMVVLAIEGLAILAHLEGEDRRGARLWGFTGELRTAVGTPLTPDRLAERDGHLDLARERIGGDGVERELAGGRLLTLQEVLAQVGAAGVGVEGPRPRA